MNQKIVHKRSNVVTDGTAKLPTADQLDYGELAINYADGNETITIKNSKNEIVSFKSQEYIDDNYLPLSGGTMKKDAVIRYKSGSLLSDAQGNSGIVSQSALDVDGLSVSKENLLTTTTAEYGDNSIVQTTVKKNTLETPSNTKTFNFPTESGTLAITSQIEESLKDDCTLLYYNGTVERTASSASALSDSLYVGYDEKSGGFWAFETSSTIGHENWNAYGDYAASSEYGELVTGIGIVPTTGKLYYNITDKQIYVWSGSTLVALGSVSLWTKIRALVSGEEVARKEADEALQKNIDDVSALLYPVIQITDSDFSALDTLGGILTSVDDALVLAQQTNKCRYVVTCKYGKLILICGFLDVLSDSMGHTLTEVFTTQYVVEDGKLTDGHQHNMMYQYFREYNISYDENALGATKGEWAKWYRMDTYTLETVDTKITDSIPQMVDGIAATVDNLPSTKGLYYYVTSEGCFYATNGKSSKGDKIDYPLDAKLLYVTRSTNKVYRWTEEDGMVLLSQMAFSDLTDTPTTLAGYGITEGVNASTTGGTGNAITNISVSGHTLIATKGSTFLTTSEASTNYLTKVGAANTYLPLAGGTLTGELKTTSNISASKGFILQVDGLSTLTLNSSGNLAIGYGYKSTSATSLQGKTVELKSGDTTILNASSTGVAVTGKVTATGTISGSSSSDERKKENIVEADALALLDTLGGVYEFDYKESGEHSVGFIAQRIKEGIFSDIVKDGEDGFKKVDYWSPKLIAAAIGAIGQLEARVKELETELAILKG